jgi:hypothetical protein
MNLAGCAMSMACLASAACGASAKQQVIDKTLETMSAEQRRSTFQDMSAVLDRHPDWVDEFYSVARTHPALMKQFLTDAAKDLKNPELARTTGELLAHEPASLEQVLVSTVDASRSNGEARAAIDRAVAKRAEPMSDIMTDSPATMEAVLRGLLTVAANKPAAKENLRRAVDKESPRMVQLVADDPKLLASMARSILEAASKDKASLMKLLKELHVL